MKTFKDCKVGDDMYIILGTSVKIEKITKAFDIDDKTFWIHTESCGLPCPRNEGKYIYMFCTRDLAIDKLKEDLTLYQKYIDTIKESINDLKEI